MAENTNSIEFIDLLTSSDIYQMAAENKQELNCKFVHIKTVDKDIIILGPLKTYRYHAQLVKYYCDENNLHAGWINQPDLYRIFDENYSVAGGGWLKIIDSAKTIELYGFSTAYGSFDLPAVEKIFSVSTQFNTFTII